MSQLGQIMTHFRLVHSMGKATGTDVVEAHRQGHLTQKEWADMIQFCRGCGWANECPEWLERNQTAANAPQTCKNRQRFAALKEMQKQEI